MFKKIPYQDSSAILRHVKLSEEAAKLVDVGAAPADVIDLLTDAALYIDLTHFFCHALPMREVIWWTCNSLELRNDDWTVAELRTIQECKQWVKEPQEGLRRRIEQQMQKIKNDRAVRWLAQAVVWNGSGSIVPVGFPVVMPAEFLYAKAAAGAINTAAVLPEWKGYQKFYQSTFSMALDLAKGGPGLMKNRIGDK
ncbi:DUF6931 family protein [Marinomonas posidonica]|uniref:Uncharacterized protein n=1 Tax=Marinomonas posidonica (strain CECT 7376 / NCIMB 14433 / IVIA-Po-181) TaxID=491952 RepID=F6D0Y3_MARPP|nr:hypothetical protein [Marinomonas posidonica]AEF53706.1 hypothetical protein Mar181_0650 [Marinomonas posidonica IVIA-Po-181]